MFNWIKKNLLGDNSGFTLIEMIIVIVIMSILALSVGPRMTSFFSTERENFAISTGLITKIFDDSYLNNRTNYLVIHLYETGDGSLEEKSEIFRRNNGLSVLLLEDGVFKDNKRKILKNRAFPESFRFEKVVLANGEIIAMGSVLIPFYPQAYSDDVIIHVLVNDEERWSIKIRKYLKEPEVIPGYVLFENNEIR